MLTKNFPSKIIIIELFLTMSKFHDVPMSHSKVFGNYDSQRLKLRLKTTIFFEVNLRGNKNIKYFLLW